MKKLFILLLFASITSTSFAQIFGQEDITYDPCYNQFLGSNDSALATYQQAYGDCVAELVGTGEEAAAKAYLAANDLPTNPPDTTGDFLDFILSQTDTGGDATEMAAAQDCEDNAECNLNNSVQVDNDQLVGCYGD